MALDGPGPKDPSAVVGGSAALDDSPGLVGGNMPVNDPDPSVGGSASLDVPPSVGPEGGIPGIGKFVPGKPGIGKLSPGMSGKLGIVILAPGMPGNVKLMS
ncbi:hypothetical protein LguiA_026744 [Lonicera macranthoides]